MGNGFHLRPVGALLLTLATVGFIQCQVLAREARQRLIQDERTELAGDAVGVATAYSTTVQGQPPLNAVNRYLRALAARPGVGEVSLVARSRYVVGAPTVLGLGSRDSDPRVVEALETGRQMAGEARGGEDGDFIFATPVDLPAGRHALVVRQGRDVLEDPVAELRRNFILLLLGGLTLAVPAFYLLGGRSLARLHRAALDRATRDGLTDLGNHGAFLEELERAMSLSRRHGEDLTLAIIDIDDFRFENDRHGQAHGDKLLRGVADSLRDGRSEDRSYRLGDDEFAVLLPRAGEEGARRALQRTAAEVRSLQSVGVSIGLSVLRPETVDAESLRDQADAALFEAKRRGGDTAVSFGEIEDSSRVVTVEKVRAVRRLLENGDIDAAYQPIVDQAAGEVLGYEGLARLSAEYGLAGPGEAFDVAAAIGRSAELDEACRRSILEGAGLLPDGALLFLNVAPQSLDRGHMSSDSLVRLVEASGLAPERVVLEVTERFAGDLDRVVAEATTLRALGFKLALDDVGAGNSGLEMLRDLKVDFVKVDRGVVWRAIEGTSARAVLASITTFARQTGAYVIAEGIETDEMLEMVHDAHGVQGFLLGRPGELPPSTSETGAKKVSAGAPLRAVTH